MASPDYDQLGHSINCSRQILMIPRKSRYEIVKEMAGHRYAGGGAERSVKLNLLSLFQTTFTNLLIANEPRYVLSTADYGSRAAVRIEQDWLNEQTVRIGLAETGRQCLTDSFIFDGICKVSLATPCDAAMQAWGITAGEPVAMAIDFDDYVYDAASRDLRGASFVGHRYLCPVDVAKKMYGKKAADLAADGQRDFNREGDERIGRILRGSYSTEDWEPHVELWEIVLPRHGMVVTLAGQDVFGATPSGKTRPLWEQKLVCPPGGPYRYLSHGSVQGSALGKGPMLDLMDPHLDANNVLRKANNTIRRMKENTLYPREAGNEATDLKNASDGDFVAVARPDMFKPLVSGGAALQGLMSVAEVYHQHFNHLSSIDLLRGAGPQSRTATQDKIMNANAGGMVQAMNRNVATFMSQIGEDILWYAHHHPQLVMRSAYKAPLSQGVERTLYPPGDKRGRNRDFPFHRAKFRIDPYSVRHRSPEERLAFIDQVVDKFAPMMPIFQSQGKSLDTDLLTSLYAEFGDTPEIAELFTASQQSPDQQQPGAGGHERSLPSQTDRSYTRRNEPQGRQPGQTVAEMSPQDFGAPSANGQGVH